MKAPEYQIYRKVDEILRGNKEHYLSNPEKFLADIYSHLESENAFEDFHKLASPIGRLIKARCMIQDSRGLEYINYICQVKENEGEDSKISTMVLRDSMHGVHDIESSEGDLGRYCYTMVPIPGVSTWFLEDGLASDNQPEPEKKQKLDELSETKWPVERFIAKFVGDACSDLPPASVVDIYGLMVDHGFDLDEENISSTNFKGIPNFHVIRHEVHVQAKTDKAVEADMITVREVLRRELVKFFDPDQAVCADFLLSAILSATHSRCGGMPICFVPLNIVGVSETDVPKILQLLRILLPKVKLLALTPSVISDVPFAPVMDYKKEQLSQGELQLATGTMLVIDETVLPDGSFAVSERAELNLKVLEQLIVEQKLYYDYGFYKIPMDVDMPIIILSKKESRVLKTPFRIPLSGRAQTDPSFYNDPAALQIIRKYIQHCRAALKDVSLSAETSKAIQEDFVTMCASVDKSIDKADLMNELLILSRVISASKGSSELNVEHWKEASNIEKERRKIMVEWQQNSDV